MNYLQSQRSGVLSGLCFVAILSGCATTIGPGRTGILWRSTDGTQDSNYGEGAYWINPWNTMYVYDLRVMSHDELLDVIAANGLSIKLDASILYRLKPHEVVALQEEIGPEYYKKILEPELRSEARRVLGRYTPEEIYSTKREIIEREIRQGLRSKIEGKHLDLEAVLIRNVQLPEAIRGAIDEKLAAEQEVLKMKYIIEVAKAKAEEQHIEAGGVADYNRSVASSLSPQILEFERIRQMSKLAAADNAKTVIIGAGTVPQLILPTQENKPKESKGR